MPSRRTRLLAMLVVTGLLSPAMPAAAGADREDRDGVTVTVPTIDYSPTADRFRVGPFRSRLHVLFNDSGLPDPHRLQLLGRRGRPAAAVTVPGRARLRVVSGYVVIYPAPGARGRVTFRYRAASPNGPAADGHAVVTLYPRVIETKADQARTVRGTSVTVAVARNDRLLVAGAVLACSAQLFAHRPARPDPRPVVLPEPDRLPIDCAGGDRRRKLVTRQGRWLLRPDGRIRFTPVAHFVGTARIYYRQASDYPFDLGLAPVSVSVLRPGTGVLGHGTGAGGPLAGTGFGTTVFVLAGWLLASGAVLVAVSRRRRQPVDLEA